MEHLTTLFDADFMAIKQGKRDKIKMASSDILSTTTETNYCIGCNSSNMIETDGHFTCRDCGLTNDCIIDSGQEWRFYGAEDTKGADPSRCGMPTNELLPKSSIGSIIGFGNGHESSSMRRVRNMHYWNSTNYRETSLLETFNNITILSQNAGINSCIIEDAKYMYAKVSEIKRSRRAKREAMKAASVMLACKYMNCERSCEEIAEAYNITNIKTLRKTIKTFEEIWLSIEGKEEGGRDARLRQVLEQQRKSIASTPQPQPQKFSLIDIKTALDNFDVEPDDGAGAADADAAGAGAATENPEDTSQSQPESDILNYLHRYCCKLNLNEQIYKICEDIAKVVETHHFLEPHIPLSKTASIIYYVSRILNLDITDERIQEICGVSGVTITRCYKKLCSNSDLFYFTYKTTV